MFLLKIILNAHSPTWEHWNLKNFHTRKPWYNAVNQKLNIKIDYSLNGTNFIIHSKSDYVINYKKPMEIADRLNIVNSEHIFL